MSGNKPGHITFQGDKPKSGKKHNGQPQGKPKNKGQQNGKPKADKTPKPDTSGIIITLGKTEYVYDWLLRVTPGLKQEDFKITDIGHSIFCTNRTGSHEVVDNNDVIRYTWYKGKIHILTGIEKVHKASELGASVMKGVNIVPGALKRCERQPEPLSGEALIKSLSGIENNSRTSMHLTVKTTQPVPKAKKKPQAKPPVKTAPPVEQVQQQAA